MTSRESRTRHMLGIAVMIVLVFFWIRQSGIDPKGIPLTASSRGNARSAAVIQSNQEGLSWFSPRNQVKSALGCDRSELVPIVGDHDLQRLASVLPVL